MVRERKRARAGEGDKQRSARDARRRVRQRRNRLQVRLINGGHDTYPTPAIIPPLYANLLCLSLSVYLFMSLCCLSYCHNVRLNACLSVCLSFSLSDYAVCFLFVFFFFV